MTLQIEEAVMEFRRQEQRQDTFLSGFYLDIVRAQAKTVTRNYGIVWDHRTEDLLKDCCMKYSIYSGNTFLSFFALSVEHEYRLSVSQSAENYFSAEAYKGSGNRTFQRTWTSTPERLTMERLPRKEKGTSEQ